jgi:hypothetical protein
MQRMIADLARALSIPVLLISSPGAAGNQQVPQVSSVKPPCAVAEDEKYAYMTEQPVQVGGSPVFGAARQRRYLDVLRGLEGQPVQYKRTGQSRAPDGTILDVYEVTHAGLEKAVTLYLDWYHYNMPKAPRGFTCAGPIGLGIPPASPFQEMDDVRTVAIGQGASHDFAPIPLASDAAPANGVIYDRFRIFALAARAAAAKESKLNPQNLPRELLQQGHGHRRLSDDVRRTGRPTGEYRDRRG